MGNCQAIDAAALVIQHPDGRIERLYWSITVSEVMKSNPGHYVSLIIPLPPEAEDHKNQEPQKTVRYTRVKLLRPTDNLALGHAYRLVTSQGVLILPFGCFTEVMKVLQANKYAKKKRQQQQQLESAEKKQSAVYDAGKKSDAEKAYQGMKKHERHSTQIASVNSTNTAMRSKSWRPSLHSISESPSSTNMTMNGPQKAC